MKLNEFSEQRRSHLTFEIYAVLCFCWTFIFFLRLYFSYFSFFYFQLTHRLELVKYTRKHLWSRAYEWCWCVWTYLVGLFGCVHCGVIAAREIKLLFWVNNVQKSKADHNAENVCNVIETHKLTHRLHFPWQWTAHNRIDKAIGVALACLCAHTCKMQLPGQTQTQTHLHKFNGKQTKIKVYRMKYFTLCWIQNLQP